MALPAVRSVAEASSEILEVRAFEANVRSAVAPCGMEL